MSLLTTLHLACFAKEPQAAHTLAEQHIAQWTSWLLPITAENPIGDDPSYHDDFERIREEVNKLSGADTDLICTLAETLLTQVGKDLPITCLNTALFSRLFQNKSHITIRELITIK